jgi:hypothetical protein
VPCVASVAENSGVTDTVPVNVSAAPRAAGRDCLGEISNPLRTRSHTEARDE